MTWVGHWIGGRQRVDHDWADLRVTWEFTARAPGVASPSFLFRARPVGKTYGDAYVWQIATANGRAVLREQVRRYPGGRTSATTTKLLREIAVPGLATLAGQRHRLVVDVVGPRVRTWIDGALVDSLADSTHVSGTVGFVSDAAAVIHEVSVDTGGRPAFRTDFAGGANPFTLGRPVEEGLLIPAGVGGKDGVLPIAAPAPLLRKGFTIARPVRRARLLLAAAGWPRILLDGRTVNDAAIESGWTDYTKRVQYRAYDVTARLWPGAHVIGVELGRGWFGVTTPNEWYFQMAPWHGAPRVRGQLEITYADGAQQVVATDSTWRSIDGPTTFDDIYLGERYDARLLPARWDAPGFDDRGWARATVVEAPTGALVESTMEPIRPVATLRPVHMTEPEPGVFVFDVGRVIAGWVRLSASGARGRTVTLVHSEKLDADGTVQPASGLIDGQLQTDAYTLAGGGMEQWEPRFGYRGFRYVEVRGYPGRPGPDALVARIVHSDVRSIGEFATSDTLLARIQQAARNTLLNNIYGDVTDTPVYEKNGWTGDAHASSRAAMLNFDLSRVLAKWLADFRDAQSPAGEIPEIVPSTPYYGYEGTPGWNMVEGAVPSWDAAALVLPWDLYELYGDRRVLADMYDAQRRLVEYTRTFFPAPSLRYTHPTNSFLGEYSAAGRPGPVDATAAAYYYHMADLLSRSAGLLGRTGDVGRYRALADSVRDAYNARYWDDARRLYRARDASGKELPYAETMNVLPVAFGMVPLGQDTVVMRQLDAEVRANGYHLRTAGVFAIRYAMTLLGDYGYAETAYRVATRTDEPSWGWWIANGHATMFEGWGLASRSRSHHYFASISSWFFEGLAGIRPAAPGFARVVIAPQVPTGLARAGAALDTPRGRVESRWTQSADGTLDLRVTVPANTPAEVRVPTRAGRPPRVVPSGATLVRLDADRAVYRVGAGSYRFVSSR